MELMASLSQKLQLSMLETGTSILLGATDVPFGFSFDSRCQDRSLTCYHRLR